MRVLFIEDDPMNRRVVRDMLGVAGVEMVEADRAIDGLRRIEEEAFDVVLLDLRMPEMDGLEALARLRARDDAKAALPVIIVTADTAPDLRERCVAQGADDVLFKPVAMDSLFDTIGSVLARRGGGVVLS